MSEQSNSANLDHLGTPELAARLGQLRLADCEAHRTTVLARLRDADPAIDPATPTIVLLRMLGRELPRSATAATTVPSLDDVEAAFAN